ncbi:hypothetical protein [Ktedonobacter racemifer]|uniref:hypothetical protein n=1 Tax=Ktedonobacter racemifer TaxID=363277 RepID=UPI00146BFBB4|nr:hypothetical protein [Ktedonobacter racemifer]
MIWQSVESMLAWTHIPPRGQHTHKGGTEWTLTLVVIVHSISWYGSSVAREPIDTVSSLVSPSICLRSLMPRCQRRNSTT